MKGSYYDGKSLHARSQRNDSKAVTRIVGYFYACYLNG